MPRKKAPPPKFPVRYRAYQVLHLLILAYISFLGWSRLALALSGRDLLVQLGARPDPILVGAGGGLWGLLGLGGIGLLFVRQTWARALTAGISAVLALTYWLDSLLLTRSPGAMANWPFAALITLVMLAFSVSLMVVLHQWDQAASATPAQKVHRAEHALPKRIRN